MTTDYRQSHLQPGKGKSYDVSFVNEPYRRMVWRLEQSIIDSVLLIFFKDQSINYLDFACGTGRILSYLDKRVTHAVGVDISSTMLEVARVNCTDTEIIEADLTKNDLLGNRKFNLITAFRFFPNAQPELRQEVMEVLTKHLNENGYLVFNNHLNAGSAFNKFLELLGRETYKGMSMAEVLNLLEKSELEIVKIYHLCVLPASESKQLLPIFILRPLEKLLSKLSFFQKFGQNLIFVCRHSNSQ